MEFTKAVALRIAELLEQNNKNRNHLHIEGGIPLSTISKIMNYRNKNIKLKTLFKICKALQISIKDFLDSPLFKDFDNLK